MGKRRPPALPSPRGEGGFRRSHARRMTDEVSCREGRGMLPQTAQGRNSSRFPTAAEIATRLHPPQAAAGRKRLAVPGKRFGLTLARLAALPFPGLLRDGPPMARLRKLRPACICHWQRQAAIPPVFRPLRKLRPACIRRRRRRVAILNNSKFGRGRLFFAGNLWYSVPIERRDR